MTPCGLCHYVSWCPAWMLTIHSQQAAESTPLGSLEVLILLQCAGQVTQFVTLTQLSMGTAYPLMLSYKVTKMCGPKI